MKQSSRDLQSTVSPAFLAGVTVLVGVWYVFLCAMHYLSQRPLWLDEFNVFLSVRDFLPHQFFTEKLAGGQIFPKLYLFLVQRVAEPFDYNLLALRFCSFLAMLTAFAVWLNIIRYEFKDRLAYLTYVLSWAGSSLLIYYSAELKPYSMDVLAAGCCVLFLYHQQKLFETRPKIFVLLLVAMPLWGLVSYPAFLFFVFPLYFLLTLPAKSRFGWTCVCGYILSMFAVAACVYYFDIRVTRADTSTQGFSDHIVSFVSAGEFFKTWGEGTTDLFGRFFVDNPKIFRKIAMPFCVLGLLNMFYLFFKNFASSGFKLHSLRTVALVLYAQLFVLGALQKYPFSVPRTSLFFCPIVLFLIVDAIQSLRAVNRPVYLVVQGAYLVFLIVVSFGLGQVVMSGNMGIMPRIY